MASGIPTRRSARRADENAPPTGAAIETRTRPAATSKPSTTAIPQLRRGASANVVPTAGKAEKTTRTRSALGEVTNGKAGDKLKGKAVAAEERKPLVTTSSTQQIPRISTRTRSSLIVDKADSAKPDAEDKPAQKRKAAGPVANVRSRPTTATTSTDGRVIRPLRDQQASADKVEEPEPVRKKRKTSSPVPDEQDDLDDALYDADGQEVVLSSGGKGVSCRSPKLRAKDHGWTDLDVEDEEDPSMVAEYVVDAFVYMMELEQQTMPHVNYMDKQAELRWEMRAVLMDWLIEVHAKFRLLPETLFIASNLVDRFLSARVISLAKFQLVGLTALFVAAKYEEVICPSVTHFIHMSDGGFDVSEMLGAERYLLNTIGFDISYPNPLNFLRRVSKADGYDIQTRTVSKYLIEISCLARKLIQYPPSVLAAGAMYLARLCLERGAWTPNLIHYSTYSEEELLPAAQTMLDYLLDPDFKEDTAFHKKYASKKHMKSSLYVRNWAIAKWPASASGRGSQRGKELHIEAGIAVPEPVSPRSEPRTPSP